MTQNLLPATVSTSGGTVFCYCWLFNCYIEPLHLIPFIHVLFAAESKGGHSLTVISCVARSSQGQHTVYELYLNWSGNRSRPMNLNTKGMKIHLPAVLMWAPKFSARQGIFFGGDIPHFQTHFHAGPGVPGGPGHTDATVTARLSSGNTETGLQCSTLGCLVWGVGVVQRHKFQQKPRSVTILYRMVPPSYK